VAIIPALKRSEVLQIDPLLFSRNVQLAMVVASSDLQSFSRTSQSL
jgi:hypothetical protein